MSNIEISKNEIEFSIYLSVLCLQGTYSNKQGFPEFSKNHKFSEIFEFSIYSAATVCAIDLAV